MSSFPPTANPEPSASLIQQWQESINQESTVLDEEQKRPVIAEFIHDCLEVYARIIHDVEAQPEPAESTLCRLRSGRHYLVLWADGYDVRNGALDRVMDSSQRLHSLAIRLLLKIGSILTQRVLPNTSSRLQQHASGDKIRVLRGLERLRLLSHSNMDADSGSDTDEEFLDDESPEEDLAQIAQDLTVTVGCLLEIGPRLNNQTMKHFKEPSKPVNVTDWHAYMNFIERIQWRYRQCDDSLATRLGKDNWSRMLKRQERILQNEAAQDRSDSPEPLDVDLATPIQPPTTLHDSGIGTSVQSPASKLAETVVTYHGGAGDSMKVPSLTQEALDGRQFKCVGCGRLIQARNMVDWKKHLFEDLRPYICFYEGCSSNSDPFDTKDEWISHILEDHSRHGAELECPICRSNLPGDAMSIVKHLSQHLEEIALMVLPSGQETEESSHDDASEDSPRNVEISGPSPQENGLGYQGDDDDVDDYRPNSRRGHKRTTSIDAKDSTSRTPLSRAAENGHTEVVQLLLETKEVDANAKGNDGQTPLLWAANNGYTQVVQLLLDKGADVNAQGGEYGNALQAASKGGHREIVRLLLDKGADVNAQGGEYGSALQAASAAGHREIVQRLKKAGALVRL